MNATVFRAAGLWFWASRLCALALAAVALGVAPLPETHRVATQVVATVQAPPDKPMHMPTAVAVDSKDRIFVADGANDRIVRFTSDGQWEAAITDAGGVSLRRPVGVFVDASDRLLIADTANHRLVVVGGDGKTAQTIDVPAADARHAANPTSAVVTADLKRTYVADSLNQRILIRDNKTGQWTPMGKLGRALGQFQWPFMLCIGDRGYLYITEVIGARVQQISPADRWAGEFGTWGVEIGQLYRPKGIATDAKGRLYVSDSSLGVVQVFSARGMFEGALADEQGKPRYFRHPMGMCFDRQNRLLVVELSANRVAVVSVAGVSGPPATQPGKGAGK